MKKSKFIIVIAFMLSLIIGGVSLYYPSENSNNTDFSYERAKEDLKVIAKEPHSTLYGQEALKDVRDYIVKELNELDMKPEVFTYKDVKTETEDIVDLSNIYGKIDGEKGKEGSYILLVAHYDSARKNGQNKEGLSFGAADDGYGVATLLEVLRDIRENNKDLVNGIKVLITDGEEMGLSGSKVEMEKNADLYKNASFVLNFEARGTSGPVIMFQRNGESSKVLDLYKRGNYPISSSLYTDLYKDSDRSDFYNLKAKDLVGMNFIAMNNSEYYHTAEDSYENIDNKTLNHYGDQVLPIVEKFVYSSEYGDVDYFKGNNEDIYFTLLPNVVVSYPKAVALALGVVLMAAVVVINIRNKDRIKGVTRTAIKDIVKMLLVSVVALAFSYILSIIAGVRFNIGHMGKIPGDDILVIIIPVVLAGFIFRKRLKGEGSLKDEVLASIIIQTILVLVLMIMLPGGSYLAMLPLLFMLLALGLMKKCKKKNSKYALLIPVVVTSIIYIPVMIILSMAFAIISLPLQCLIVMIMVNIIIPSIKYILK